MIGSPPLGRLPDFLVVGAARAGTTSLWQYLRSHPDVHMPGFKEPSFFAEGCNWDRGIDWYRRQFENARNATAVGEASAVYSDALNEPGVPRRILQVLPDVRLVYLLRNPVERLVSEQQHLYGRVGDELDEAVLDEAALSRSRYALQAERYLEVFGRDRLLMLTLEDLVWRPTEVTQRAFRFLGVDPHWIPPNLAYRYNARPNGHCGLSHGVYREVVDRLREDVERLRDLLGPEFRCWGLLDDEAEPSDDHSASTSHPRIRATGRLPEGFRLLPDFITPSEQSEILRWIDREVTGQWCHNAERAEFMFDGSCGPMPDWMQRFVARIADGGLFDEPPGHALMLRFEPGQGFPAHQDADCYGDTIAGLTLGSTRILTLSRQETPDVTQVLLKPGDLYVMSGGARQDWYHSMPRRRIDEFGGRSYRRGVITSITFRRPAATG